MSRHRRRLLAGLLTVACAAMLAPAAATRADDVQTVSPGGVATVHLADSNILAVCTPPGSFHPNAPTYVINPSSVALVSSGPELMATAQDTVQISVPADHSPYQTITISWSGTDTCTSWNGSVQIRVGAPGSPPSTGADPSPAPGPGEIVPPDRTVRTRSCGTVSRGARTIQVSAQGDLSCSEARAAARGILRGRSPAGYRCRRSGAASSAQTIWVCSRGSDTVFLGPRGTRSLARGTCGSVQHRGRTYAVSARRVTCRYARATALRMLRNERPYIYEFETARQARRWTCPQRTNTVGSCFKRVENRYVGYILRD